MSSSNAQKSYKRQAASTPLAPYGAIFLVSPAMSADPLFISDLHLSADRPATHQQFLQFLQGPAATASALYILGDLFDYWGGDDIQEAWQAPLLDALTAYSQQHALFLMHGNRDCLIGPALCQQIGAQYLPDPTVILWQDQRIVLAHGDAQCTDDVRYQAFRQQVRNPAWQQTFLARPAEERLAEIARIRQVSETEKATKSMAIMDVNQNAVQALLDHYGVNWLIHGHTHRPARHHWHQQGQSYQRNVLPDWDQGRGGYLRLSEPAELIFFTQSPLQKQA
jgi:UDP-2,3-diacylglucosamine hydrolase